jgi:WD40 repeat protein
LEGLGSVDALAVAPDGSWLAFGGDRKTIRIWDVITGKERMVMTLPKEAFLADVRTLGVAPDGSWLASAGYDKTIRIWDMASGQQRAALTGHTEIIWTLAIAPDGRWIASADNDATIRIWDATNGDTIALMRVEKRIRSCAWLGATGLVLGGDAGLYLFDFKF